MMRRGRGQGPQSAVLVASLARDGAVYFAYAFHRLCCNDEALMDAKYGRGIFMVNLTWLVLMLNTVDRAILAM